MQAFSSDHWKEYIKTFSDYTYGDCDQWTREIERESSGKFYFCELIEKIAEVL